MTFGASGNRRDAPKAGPEMVDARIVRPTQRAQPWRPRSGALGWRIWASTR
jgi:hypothetical protein